MVHESSRTRCTKGLAWFRYDPPVPPIGAPTGLRLISVHAGPAWFGQMGDGFAGGSVPQISHVRVGGQSQPPQPPQGALGTLMQAAGPSRSTIVLDRDGNPAVLDTLVKLTDHTKSSFGYNRDSWRRWWANEKANRDLQKRPTDKPISPTELPVDRDHLRLGVSAEISPMP